MIPIKAVPEGARSAVSIDPGANGGWALWYCLLQEPKPGRPCGQAAHMGWVLYKCGLARPSKCEDVHPTLLPPDFCIGELPQYQKGDAPRRINDLFVTSMRLGLLAKSTGSRYLWTRAPHDWKGSVDKTVHNGRVLKRLSQDELGVLAQARTGAGGLVPDSLQNNVIDAIGLGLVSLGRW